MMWTGSSHPAQFVTGSSSQILRDNDHFAEQTYIFLMPEYVNVSETQLKLDQARSQVLDVKCEE
ncbi:hypothetical protein BKA82DRAFT_1005374 [Pisolithus tinctorius]|nr:hypothetical protein BKA82DRAFT_1005374 [Pisolithus tinctorius]